MYSWMRMGTRFGNKGGWMKFAKAREGERFVFPDRGGIWMKTGEDKAEMVFPSKTRKCGDIDKALEVYVIFEKDKKAPALKTDGKMKVVLMDQATEKPLLQIDDATAQQVAAYTYTEDLRMTPKGKRKVREYSVVEVIMDHDTQSLVLVLRDVTESVNKVHDI
jgi:hypothetical protein